MSVVVTVLVWTGVVAGAVGGLPILLTRGRLFGAVPTGFHRWYSLGRVVCFTMPLVSLATWIVATLLWQFHSPQ
jgi:hypothetical protein